MSVASALPLLSPLVTRILELSGFPPHLKTRDLQHAFAIYEDDKGGYKIKWVDDTTALIIFADPATAKKAYLRTIMAPPQQLINDTGVPAKIKPYDGDDASAIISSVSNRQRSRSNAGGVMGSPNQATRRACHARHARPFQAAARPCTHAVVRPLARPPPSAERLQPQPSAQARSCGVFDAANGGPSPANRVLAGDDTLSGIAGLPANPVAAARLDARRRLAHQDVAHQQQRRSQHTARTRSMRPSKRFSPASAPSALRQSPLPRGQNRCSTTVDHSGMSSRAHATGGKGHGRLDGVWGVLIEECRGLVAEQFAIPIAARFLTRGTADFALLRVEGALESVAVRRRLGCWWAWICFCCLRVGVTKLGEMSRYDAMPTSIGFPTLRVHIPVQFGENILCILSIHTDELKPAAANGSACSAHES
ncbi:hypothetical protein L1887_59069 [Cichorium endivia]|nr:hypothetical protein L1887_59069 [Cichorium endivia]